MKVFLSAFRLLSKVKAAILTTRTWYLSSNMPTRKYEKTDRANEIYKSELGLPIIPTITKRSIKIWFGTNWLSFIENITVLLQHDNLPHSFTDILILHSWLFYGHYCTDFNKLFLFSYKFDMLFSFF